jgi:hypothetical protein
MATSTTEATEEMPMETADITEEASPTGTDSMPEMTEITIRAMDYSYEIPGDISAGLLSLTMVNDGMEPHHAQVVKLNDDTSVEQFTAALPQGEAAIFPLVTFRGGPGLVGPGAQSSVFLNLEEGTYVLLCFVASPDGVPHLAKGMVLPFMVSAGSGDMAEAPQPDLTITMKDFSFELPETVSAGPQIWEINNLGPQIHELMIVQPADGMTQEDITAFLQTNEGEPPFIPLGGMQALSTGETGWMQLDLEAGDYIIICFVPDPASGIPHANLGMIMPLTVE